MPRHERMFDVGDTIIQRHQRGAGPRLVVALADDPHVVWVFDAKSETHRRVHTWSHDLLDGGTPETIEEALRRAKSNEFRECRWK